MKILGVVGTKNTGKTTLTTLIVKEMVKRGYAVGTIKHTHHDFDIKETDTWKHHKSGAKVVVGSGKNTFFFFEEKMELDTIIKKIKNLLKLDFLVIEGYKFSNYAKISTSELKDEFTIDNVNPFELKDENISDLLDLIEERTYDLIPGTNCGECGFDTCMDMAKAIIKGEKIESDCKMKRINEVELFMGNRYIPLNPFVQDFLKNAVLGMISTLKTDDSIDAQQKVELYIKNGKN